MESHKEVKRAGHGLQMRLLCTYFGAGTEFVENRFADRRPLQRLLFQDTQGYGVRDERAVQAALPGDVLYLKGHAFPGNAGVFLALFRAFIGLVPLCAHDLPSCHVKCTIWNFW